MEIITPTTPTQTGILKEMLMRSASDTRKGRAKNLLTVIDTKLQIMLQNYFMELREISIQESELLDVSPSSTFTTKMEVNVDELVEKIQELALREAELNTSYQALSSKYETLMGKKFVPSLVSMDEDL